MFNFFGSFFHKTVIMFVGLMASIGLVSAPLQNSTATIQTSSIPQAAVQQANSTSSSEALVVTPTSTPSMRTSVLPSTKKISVVPSVSPVSTSQNQPQATTAPQRQSVVNTPPPNATLCNGTYYTACSAGEDFVCPASGGAYCQPSQQQQQQQTQYQQQQSQAAAAQQQTQNQIDTLTTQYNNQLNALNQQILNIKTQYYSNVAAIQQVPEGVELQDGQIQKATDDANSQIQQIQLQEQQLQLTYQEQLSALQ